MTAAAEHQILITGAHDILKIDNAQDTVWNPAYRGTFEVLVTREADVKVPGRRVTRTTHGGHPLIQIGENGKDFKEYLDLLVAITYLPRRPERFWELRHIDGDWKNCHADNLQWFRPREAYEDALGDLLQPSPPCRCPEWMDCGCRPYYVKPRKRHPDRTSEGWHGRAKVQTRCRRGHALAMDGEPDEVTGVWGVGNRICLTCAPRAALVLV